MNYYLVNLTDTYKKVIEYQCLWINKPSGRNIFHWDNILRVQKNDLIFCNIDGYIKSICIAKDICYDSEIPYKSDEWLIDGRRLDIEYVELDNPIHIQDIGEQLLNLQRKKYGAFCITKNNEYKTNAGYLFELSYGQAEYLLTFINRLVLPQIIQDELENELKRSIQEKMDSDYILRKIYQGIILPYDEYEIIDKVDSTRLKATCLVKADYCCEINDEHSTFIHTSGLHPYVECHHIIPLKAQVDFPNVELDDLFNLVALCPSCHAQIHYGNVEAKKEIFYKLYARRITEMMERNISQKDMERVFEKYYM